ncbi:hypothetical protein GAYE_HTGSCF06PCTG21G0329 [Galdieria yellowstonensis]|uniref:AD domain-containing protein n=1 Tax=Galdieria yellowstonensis TaxID=3028027 RepID=A0AAV9I4S6_9RHOD|nr:hypothetical protein GAYE_HTGSCF06PCTG21G0329 [Galdieria yellowstonensis]
MNICETLSPSQQHLSEALKNRDYMTCIWICEELELQSSLQGQPFEFYTLFFFLLLLRNQCHLAHFLWKRCPYSQREPRLMTLREIALALCREDYETAFSLCRNTDWQELNQLATDFLEVWRARLANKLQSTYTVISVTDCCRYLGMSREEWMAKPYWRMEGEYVFPDRRVPTCHLLSSLQGNHNPIEDPLETLTRMKTTWLQDIGYLIEVVCTQEIQVKGYLYTVDPNTNNLILLNDYDPTTTKFHQLTLVMGSAIQEMKRLQVTEEPELTNRIRQTDQVEQLLVQQHTTETTQVSSAIEQRRNKLLELLNKYPWKTEWDPTSGIIRVMEGLVRIEPPYTEDSCFSTQQNVLLQVVNLLETMETMPNE